MKRLARILGSALAALVAASILSAGAASALGTTTPGYAFGAQAPVGRLAPRIRTFATANVAAALPVSADLRKWAVTPGYQGQLNSCVPWTVDYALLGWYSRYSSLAGQPFAPMYTYSQINGGGDYGSTATAALQIAVTQGSDTRVHYVQGDMNFTSRPTAAEHANAAQFKIKGYTTIFLGIGQAGTATLLKQAISTYHPVAIEMAVRAGFENLASGAAAVDNDSTTPILGYHEVLAVGYDAAGLIVQNSWGTGWGNGGFGRISWKVVQADVGEGETISGFVRTATAPTVSAPVAQRVSAATKAGTIAYKVSWKGTAGTSGTITRYDVWYQYDQHAFVAVKLTALRATSFALTTVRGHHYRIEVRATATNKVGAVRYGAVFVAQV